MDRVNRQLQSISQGTRKVPWLTLILTTLFTGIYLAGPALFKVFVFDQVAIGRGEFWRVLTGHFVHCNFEHLFWDLVGWVILGAVIEIHRRHHLIPSLIFTCLTVSFWLYLGDTSYPTYCGLSGTLNGLLVVAVVIQWQLTRNHACLLVILATLAKMIYEFTTHQTIFTSLSAQAVPAAHTAGFLAGAIYMLLQKSSWKNLKEQVP